MVSGGTSNDRLWVERHSCPRNIVFIVVQQRWRNQFAIASNTTITRGVCLVIIYVYENHIHVSDSLVILSARIGTKRGFLDCRHSLSLSRLSERPALPCLVVGRHKHLKHQTWDMKNEKKISDVGFLKEFCCFLRWFRHNPSINHQWSLNESERRGHGKFESYQ